MMRMRSSLVTSKPKCSHMRRIWRFSPCTSVMRNTKGASRFTLHFLVTAPRMGTPAPMPRINSSVTGLSTVTRYSFS